MGRPAGEAHGGRQHTRIGLVVQGTDAPFIYDSERDKEGQFQFDVPNGTYTLRIHFCETWPDASKVGFRLFNINIQHQRVVSKMDITGPAGGWMKPYVKEFPGIRSPMANWWWNRPAPAMTGTQASRRTR